MPSRKPPLTVKLVTTIVFVVVIWFAQERGWLNESAPHSTPPATTESASFLEGRCTRVVDGDTIDVQTESARYRVRIIGIDCAESHNQDKAARQARTWSISASEVRRQGRAATEWVEDHVARRSVRLVLPEGRATDDYDRLLAYVEVDGEDIGASLLKKGLAESRREPHPRKRAYQQLEKQAQHERAGLWRNRS